MIVLNTKAKERSTYGLSLTFKDSSEEIIDPINIISCRWSLRDKHSGDIINGRNKVSLNVDENPKDLYLWGKDLALFASTNTSRIVTVEATYNSDEGDNLPLIEEVEFPIENFKYITYTTTTTTTTV
jgi:hypothetical protein